MMLHFFIRGERERRFVKRSFILLGMILLFILSISIIRVSFIKSHQLKKEHLPSSISFLKDLKRLDQSRADQAIQRLSSAVQIEVISVEGPAPLSQTNKFIEYLERSFPRAYARLNWKRIGQSLLIHWSSSTTPTPSPSSSSELAPVLFIAHFDTVPAEGDWEEGPYSGAQKDGWIWGRGTLDDKQAVMGIMEAIESSLSRSFKPKRDLYFVFGHDEEVGGTGARAVSQYFKEEGISFAWALDEGGVITQGIIPGLDRPRALIGVAEKGYVSLEITAEGAGGHSSMPPKHTAAGVLSAALTQLEDHPFPMQLNGASRLFMEWVAPEMPMIQRWALSQLWLTAPLVKQIYDQKPSTAAVLRTTTAITQLRGSHKENVLPQRASAVVNFRVLPGETPKSVEQRTRTLLSDHQVKVTLKPNHSEPSELSMIKGTQGEGFRAIQYALTLSFPDVDVAPFLNIGVTDSRHFKDVVDQIYRFTPIRLNSADLKRIHGKNERIHRDNYLELILFYTTLIQMVR